MPALLVLSEFLITLPMLSFQTVSLNLLSLPFALSKTIALLQLDFLSSLSFQQVALALAVAFALLASYFDLKKRIVPDWLNAVFFVIALGMGVLMQVDLVQQIAFACVAFAFAFVLYRLGGWAGGDAKFYAALLSFYPLFKPVDYSVVLLVFFASIVFLIPFLLLAKRWRRIVATSDLNEGMIPAESVIVKNGNAEKIDLSLLDVAMRFARGRKTFDGKVVANAFLARGLEKAEIVELKKLRGLRFLQVREALAFSPLVATAFFAVILT